MTRPNIAPVLNCTTLFLISHDHIVLHAITRPNKIAHYRYLDVVPKGFVLTGIKGLF